MFKHIYVVAIKNETYFKGSSDYGSTGKWDWSLKLKQRNLETNNFIAFFI